MAASSQNVDFSNVKDGGQFNRKRIPAGDYLATITKVEDAKAKDGIFQYLVSIKINKKPSSVFPYYCKLQENQLWKLRNLLIAAGKTVPKKKVKVDVNVLVGKIIGVTVEDDEYEKDGEVQLQSNISGVFPAAELADIADEDMAPDEDEEDEAEDSGDDLDIDDSADEADDEEEDEGPDYSSMSRAELKAAIKELDAKFQAKKSQTDDDLRDVLSKLAGAAPTAADDDEDEEEDDEEVEAPKPAPKAKRKPKPSAADVSDEELDELDIDDL